MGIIFCRYPTDFSYINRGVARGGGQGVRALPEFGRSVNPIQTRGQIIPLTLLTAPPDSKSYLHL